MVDISDLIGRPYSFHGRGPDSYDCYGLVIEVERRFGVNLPDFDYQAFSDSFISSRVSMAEANHHAVRIDGFTEGAIVLFSNLSGYRNHIGVYMGEGYVAHCNRHGVHLEKIDLLRRFISGVYVWQK